MDQAFDMRTFEFASIQDQCDARLMDTSSCLR